jgi:phage FluMu protein Com
MENENMSEIRCVQCGKLLCKAAEESVVELRCRKCGRTDTYRMTEHGWARLANKEHRPIRSIIYA